MSVILIGSMWVSYESKLLMGSVILQVKAYLKKEFEKHGAVVNESHHDALVEDIFDKEDEDKDGFISAREFTYKHDELQSYIYPFNIALIFQERAVIFKEHFIFIQCSFLLCFLFLYIFSDPYLKNPLGFLSTHFFLVSYWEEKANWSLNRRLLDNFSLSQI